MLRIICKQLKNRWKANVWIYVELLLVFCLIWYMVDYFFVLQYNRSIRSCRDLSHTWLVDMAQLPVESADYQPGESDSTALEANFGRLLDRIRHFEGVEAVTVMDRSDLPGSGSFYGWAMKSNVDSTARGVIGQRVSFDPQTDFFKVFRITTPDGKPVSVADFNFSEPNAMLLSRLGEEILFPGQKAVGQKLFNMNLADEGYMVKGVVGDVKRFDYSRPQVSFYIPERTSADNIKRRAIAIRSNASIPDARFQQAFKETMEKELRIGNFYLKRIQLFEKIEKKTEAAFGVTNNYRVRVALMLFFLVNIMLCVVGTFWYRVRQRHEEIGLRMAMGSSRAGIRRLLYSEGLCLLVAVVLPAMLIEAQFVYLDLIDTLGKNEYNTRIYLPDRLVLRFFITNGLTFAFLSLAILAAIWFPADKASKMQPAEALHDE